MLLNLKRSKQLRMVAMVSQTDVLVIGGGVIGLACAHYLNESGIQVTIVDKGEVGSGSSHGNCGLLYFSDIYPLCVPGAVSSEIKRTLAGTSPMHIKPTLNVKRLLWLLKFAVNCRQDLADKAAVGKQELLQYSMDLFERDVWPLEEIQCDLDDSGVLMAFKDKANFMAYREEAESVARAGYRYRQIFPGELRRFEPALSEELAGGWHSRHDHHLRPDLLMSSWKKLLQDRGVEMVEDCTVTGMDSRNRRITTVETDQGSITADQVVLAAGAWSPQLMNYLPFRCAMEPGKGYSITMDRPDICPTHPCYLYEKNVVATPWKSGYRLGGTMEFSGYSTRMNRKRLEKLATGAAEYLKEPQGVRVEEWTSLRPMTNDDMPIIGKAPNFTNLAIATGHGMLGLTLASGTGKIVCDLVMEKKPEVEIRPFRVERFS